MAKCAVCGKGVHFGNNVSHSHRRSNHSWKSNIKKVKVDEPAVEQKQEQLTLEQQAAMEKLKQMGEQAATGDENGSKDDDMPF